MYKFKNLKEDLQFQNRQYSLIYNYEKKFGQSYRKEMMKFLDIKPKLLLHANATS